MAHSMQGIIALWSGAVVDIPFGWRLCDGTNGTPDLRDKFIRGAGLTFNPGVTGGATTHFHANSHGSHSHDLAAGGAIAAGSNYSHTVSTTLVSNNTTATAHMPPYYCLCYIMHI